MHVPHFMPARVTTDTFFLCACSVSKIASCSSWKQYVEFYALASPLSYVVNMVTDFEGIPTNEAGEMTAELQRARS